MSNNKSKFEATEEWCEITAKNIHNEWCNCDDKNCSWQTKIYDWLIGGSYGDEEPLLEELILEWMN
jgi:hypothetical protein